MFQTSFTVDSMNFSVSALCHPDLSGDNHHLFFLVDKELPGNGFLETGSEQYLIADASAYGASNSYYIWGLNTSPGSVETRLGTWRLSFPVRWQNGSGQSAAFLDVLEGGCVNGPVRGSVRA